jgi:hypothetical protein
MDQERPTPPTKDDVLAILRAHRDLGPEYDSHLADQIIDLWHHPRGSSHEGFPGFRRPMPSGTRDGSFHSRRVAPILALSIPLLAIAGSYAHFAGVVAVLGLDAIAMLTTRN